MDKNDEVGAGVPDSLLNATRQFKKGSLRDLQKELQSRGELSHPDAAVTEAESRVGQALVAAGIRAEAQFFVGGHEFDFRIKGYSILVEVDGAVHRTPEKQFRDAKKDRLAAIQGFTVLRFLNRESVDVVVRDVRKVISRSGKCPREVWVVEETFWERFVRKFREWF